MQVADHVYAFPVTADWFGDERTWYPTAVESDRGLYLFDACGPGKADDLAAAMADDGLDLDDVTKVFLTHHDYDHVGSLGAVVDRTGAEVLAHAVEAPYVAGATRRLNRPEEPYEGVPVDVELTDGERFRTRAGRVSTEFTPGHSPGHLCFYVEDPRVLIAGDLLRSDAEPLGAPNPRTTPDVPAARESILRLSELRVETVIAYHGGPTAATGADVRYVYDVLADEG